MALANPRELIKNKIPPVILLKKMGFFQEKNKEKPIKKNTTGRRKNPAPKKSSKALNTPRPITPARPKAESVKIKPKPKEKTARLEFFVSGFKLSCQRFLDSCFFLFSSLSFLAFLALFDISSIISHPLFFLK